VASRIGSAILAALAAVLLLGAAPSELTGRVASVADGDTLTLETPTGAHVRIRLTEVDAPEAGQPGGDAARRQLETLVQGRQVRIATAGTDRYGRTLGRVHSGPLDVNAELVRRGAAWAFTRYQTDPAFPRLEAEARADRRGLWAEGAAVAPWDWRAGAARADLAQTIPAPARTVTLSRQAAGAPAPARSRAPTRVAATGSAAFGPCGAKTRCSQMTSCAEARWYLRQCRAPIDGDGDGRPCETMCAGG